MSTGANCRITEKKPGQWYYELQCYPYGQTEDYETEGPFKTFREAKDHLHHNHSNPGGATVNALPGCPHDLLRPYPFAGTHERFMRHCDRCGGYPDIRTAAEKAADEKKALWVRDDIQFPRLLAEIYGVGLSAKQERDLMKSMDLTREEIYDLLERADKQWEQDKADAERDAKAR